MIDIDTPPAVQEDIKPRIRPFFTGSMWLPPSVNMAYKVIKVDIKDSVTGRVREVYRIGPTAALEQFKESAALMLSQGYHDGEVLNKIREAKRKHKHVPLHVHLDMYFPTMWQRDLDGPQKFAIDAACNHLGINDNQVVRITSEKLVDLHDPRVEIEIRIIVR